MTAATDDILGVVGRTADRLQRHALTAGASITLSVTVVVLFLLAGIDLLWPLSVPMRVGALTATVTATTAGAVWLLLLPWLRPLPTRHVVLRIERLLPDVHSRIITVLDLSRRGADDAAHPAMRRMLLDQAAAAVAGYRVEQVADPTPARRTLQLAGVVVLLALAATVSLPDRMPTALARLLAPTADIIPASWVRFHAEPGDVEVLQGDSATLTGVVERGRLERMSIRLRAAAGPWVTYPMTRAGRPGRFTFQVTRVESDYEYQLVGGRTWTPVSRVRMVARPVVTGIELAISLPEYLRLPRRDVPDGATRISAPVGSMLHVAAAVAPEAVSGRIVWCESAESSESTGRIAMTFDASTGRWRGDIPVQRDALWSMVFHNRLGTPSVEPAPITLHATADLPPALAVERPGRSLVIDAAGPVTVEARAFDDLALDRVGIQISDEHDDEEWSGARTTWLAQPQEPTTTLAVRGTLELAGAASIRYRLIAVDRKQQTAVSPPYTLALAQGADPEIHDALIAEALRQAALDLARWERTPSDEALQSLVEHLEDAVERSTDPLRAAPEVAARLRELLEQARKLLGEGPDTVGRAAVQLARDLERLALIAQRDEAGRDALRTALRAAAAVRDLDAAQRLLDRERSELGKLRDQLHDLQQRTESATEAQIPQRSGEQEAFDPQALAALEKAHKLLSRADSDRPTPAPAPPKSWKAASPAEAPRRGDHPSTDAGQPRVDRREDLQRHQGELDQHLSDRRQEAQRQADKLGGVKRDLQEALAELREAQRRERQSHDGNEAEKPERHDGSGQGVPKPKPTGAGEKMSDAQAPPGPAAAQDARTDESERGDGQTQDGAPKGDGQSSGQSQERTSEVTRKPSASTGFSDSEAPSEGTTPDAAPLSASAQATRKLRQLLQSVPAQQGLRLAQSLNTESPGDGSEHAGLGRIARVDDAAGQHREALLDGLNLDPKQRASLYRLPPALRDALLQGIGDEPVEAYQPWIESYYRALSEERP